VPPDADSYPWTAAGEIVEALGSHRGTVTELLEQRSGEAVDAQVLAQVLAPVGDEVPWRPVPPSMVVLHRSALLVGRASRRPYVYAESEICAETLPDGVRRRLESTADPIGRVLSDHGVESRREVLPGPVDHLDVDRGLTGLLERALLSRRYRIMVGGRPSIVINEWFLPATSRASLSERRAQRAGLP
jgi:chorismate-pyruvate lyase